MRHVNTIKKLIDRGDTVEANNALDNLLSLGPNNIEALKLRAMLLKAEGRFTDEAKIWDRIVQVDCEDEDAINYLYRQQIEDREHFYFTDLTAEGGRRYMAYPKSLVTAAVVGLFGCVFFLMLTRLASQYAELNQPPILLGTFGVLVMGPWLAILHIYMRSIRSITILPGGIEINTRWRNLRYQWPELDRALISHAASDDNVELTLILIPKDETNRMVSVDLNEDTSAVRARTYLIREIGRTYPALSYVPAEHLQLPRRRMFRF